MKDNYGCTKDEFDKEFAEYINGFYDTYDTYDIDEHYGLVDVTTEAFLIGCDISNGDLSGFDKGKLRRYRFDIDKR